MIEMIQLEFMQNAILGGILASITCGIIGSFIVTKRLVFISGGVAHASFGGIGLGFLLGFNPYLGAIIFGTLSGIGIAYLTKKTNTREDTSIGILWTFGMSLGLIFVHLAQASVPDLDTYLFGNILTISKTDLLIMGTLNIFIIIIIILFFKEFVAISFDEEYTITRGIPVFGFYLLLITLISFGVILLIKIVGIILIIALFTLPAATCQSFSKNIQQLIFYSILCSVITILVGLYCSISWDIPASASIIGIGTIGFVLSKMIYR